MKSMKWGVALSVVGGTLLLAGCQEPVKMVSAAQMENYRQLERLNEQQAAQITSLQIERDRLTRENEAILLRMQEKDKLLAAQTALMNEMKKDGIGQNETSVLGKDGEEVVRAKGGFFVRVPGDVCFDAGSATLKSTAQPTLKKIASHLKNKKNKIEVRGYSDSQPIKVSHWKSNLELSAARAKAVEDMLKTDGIAADRLSHKGFGDSDLIMDANGKEDQKRSRRVEIFVADEAGADTVKAPEKAPAKVAPPTTVKKEEPKPVVVPK